MEVIFSAVVGELASRSVSFLMDRYLNYRAAPTEDESLGGLQRMLLRVRVIVEEAEQRRVTNQAVLQQLDILREEMYRGCYVLDMSRCRACKQGQNAQDREVTYFAVSRFHPAKRVCLRGTGGGKSEQVLRRALGSLETIIADANELIMLLTGCPRLGRQPYSMHMLLDKCMLGRQMEMEQIIAFLLQAEGRGARKPGVLPVVGSRRVGKSTLVEHACRDERVRQQFSQIVSFTLGDIEGGDTVTLTSAGVIKHRNHAVDEERVLVIVELDGHGDRNSQGLGKTIIEGLLGRLHSAYGSCSRIIITSRSDKIASFGTTQPLRLQRVTQEAYWYLFKVLAFGSADAAEHPKLVSIAMDMAMVMNGCFMSAHFFGRLLRSNFNARFWSLALATLREFMQKNLFMYEGRRQADPREVTTKLPACSPKETEHFVFLDDYQAGSAHGEVPKITLQDVLFGGARPQGKFDVVAWNSPIPPHFNYVYSCEIHRPQHKVARKKRLQKTGSS